MKLRPLATLVCLAPLFAALCFRRRCQTLSATAKKPASAAGSLFLRLTISRRTPLLLHQAPASHPYPALKFITQTPSSP